MDQKELLKLTRGPSAQSKYVTTQENAFKFDVEVVSDPFFYKLNI